jgi:hypothetical protein
MKTKFFISRSTMDAIHSANVYNIWAIFETELHVHKSWSVRNHWAQRPTKNEVDSSGERGREGAGERIITICYILTLSNKNLT